MSVSPYQQLLNKGFVKYEKLFSDKEMEDLRLKSEAVLYRTLDEHRERFKSNGSLCNIAELPEYASLLCDQRILKAITQLGGKDIRWTSGYLISKPAGGAPLFWHQDWWGWDSPISYTPEPAQLFVMIYLTETSVKNGCLRVIPGSHRHLHPLHELPTAHSKSIATEIDEQSPTYASHPDEVPVPVSLGDVLIGDSRLLHSAYANTSSEERPLLTLWYIPNWGKLPNNVQAALQSIYERKVVDIDDANDNLPTPEGWPKLAYNKIQSLIPNYLGDSIPLSWNRTPDRTKLLKLDRSKIESTK